MSVKKEKSLTKKAPPLEAGWRMRLACLEAGDPRPDGTSVRERTEWVNAERDLVTVLRQRPDFAAKKSTFFMKDFDAVAMDFCFSVLAQMNQNVPVDLNKLVRWGTHSHVKPAQEALALLKEWQTRFRLNDNLGEMMRSLVRMQSLWFARTDHFHLHSDGIMLIAVWEGKAVESFREHGPKNLLDLEKLPHSILFNHRTGENAQLAVAVPLVSPVTSPDLLRCLVIVEPQASKTTSSLLSAS